jgi:mannose-6-phosphate isomerase-like protein (cupin superfamily)
MTERSEVSNLARRGAGVTATPFPGGTGITHLTVYDWANPDGTCGGSAHLHLACTEGYVVLSGRGRLQTLSGAGFAETPLTPLTVAWFGPGVIHRLVNEDRLQILVVMQNSGLPEAGDAVLTFPPEILADADRYRAAASLADPGKVYASDEAAARRRRDLAIEGFEALREQMAADGPDALAPFYAAAAALVRERVPQWRQRWQAGALAAATTTGEHLDHLAAGDAAHLRDGRLTVQDAPEDRKFGMCGRLATYP